MKEIMIAILSALLSVFIIWIAIIIGKIIYPGLDDIGPLWIYAALLPVIVILIGWAGEKIYQYTHSIGRRISFFLLLFLLVIWSIFILDIQKKWSYAFGTIAILLALILSVILIVMMSVKDKATSFILVIPAIFLLIGSILTWKVANRG